MLTVWAQLVNVITVTVKLRVVAYVAGRDVRFKHSKRIPWRKEDVKHYFADMEINFNLGLTRVFRCGIISTMDKNKSREYLRGLSASRREELAEIIGVTQNTLYRWAHNFRTPSRRESLLLEWATNGKCKELHFTNETRRAIMRNAFPQAYESMLDRWPST